MHGLAVVDTTDVLRCGLNAPVYSAALLLLRKAITAITVEPGPVGHRDGTVRR